ncbi:MAG TPA: helix-turn-helix transcriptional regulator [Candidatus Angelobacter sp.]
MSKGRVPNALTRKLGARVRSLRKKHNWTQAELGDRLGIDRGHVSEIECGKRMVTLDTLQTLAKGFDITMSTLLKGA